ncbi:MAG TPA: DUF4340 domain-containing protein [Dehalococcoidia bacterium]|nr:hypothetical protein [Chloroflexota bacterium]MDP5877132.1 DUF4340 domain-containing protein [Dehalococcoidia bacterium]MDP7160987.1 DUF4340 domain-containing protein [Dehalococcoidia bacterium]MDP7213961.1 DUF4340 domain-containing protein [Dehalococcoidia bacterium]MDP7514429.1 DUF4340 domain-containing protein [Dehalococcoidia bacterium]
MNLRFSLVLVILVSLSSIVVTFVVTDHTIERVSEGVPFFYTLPEGSINRVEIDSPNGVIAFELDPVENYWIFAGDDTMPVDRQRWNGITTILGGPRSQRQLETSFGDPSLYGLEIPDTSVTIGLTDGSTVRLLLGDETPDRSGNYAQLEGFPQLVLVSSAWGEVLTGLIEDPPIPEWRYDLNVAEVTEVVFLIDNEVVGALALDIEADQWHVCNLPLKGDAVCDGDLDIDEATVLDPLHVFADPVFIGVEEVGEITDEVQALYGITDNSPYATVRFEVQVQQGVRQANQVSLTLGDLTPDGTGMYALANEQPDVLVIDAKWGQSIRNFFDLPTTLASEEPSTPAPAG